MNFPPFTLYKNAYTGLSRSTWLLSLVILINRSGTMVVPFLTLYLTSAKMGYSISQAGFVFGLFGLGAFTGAFVGGKLTDKIGFYPVQLITLCGGGILFFVLAEMKTYSLICLFTYLLSFINEAFRPANSTAIAFYSKIENRTRSYALNRLAINLGWAVGSALGGILAKINYEFLFWVDGSTNILAALLLILFLKRAHNAKQPVDKPHKQEEANSKMIGSAYKDKTYLLFILLVVFFASCFFQLFTNLTFYYKTELHFSEPVIGFLLAINGIIIALVEMVLIYKLEGRRPNLVYISFGVMIVGFSFLILTIPGIGFTLALLMIISVTIGEILSMPFMNSFWISRTQHENRGQYAALYSMAWSAAQTLGPLSGSQVVHHLGFFWLWLFAGIICLLVSFSFRKMYQNNKTQ
jgi:predicted MFS family arabinose efflux permease